MTRSTRVRLVGLAATTAMMIAVPAQADVLDLDLLDFPDVASSFIDVTYDADADAFAAVGFATSFDDGSGPASPISMGSFNLFATIDDAGVLGGGSIEIGGSVDGFGPTLLTGDLTDFGFMPGGGQILEFTFNLTGGELAGLYGGVGSTIGVILDIDSGTYSGDFGMSFDNLAGGVPGTGFGVADVAPVVPAPATLALFAGLATAGRRRRA